MSRALTPPPPLDPLRHALFLDFDGTLVDFAPTPGAVKPRPGTVARLQALHGLFGGALAIISGRRIADIDGFLQPLALPAAGVHGQELRLPDGKTHARSPSPEIAEARRRLQAALATDDPLRLEDKGAALVIHFREHPQEGERAKTLARQAAAGLSQVRVVDGHAVAELRERGVDKAGALVALLGHSPFKGRAPVFVGDDATDEDGFGAADRNGGFGVKVGPEGTAAAYRLADVAAVHDWLANCA